MPGTRQDDPEAEQHVDTNVPAPAVYDDYVEGDHPTENGRRDQFDSRTPKTQEEGRPDVYGFCRTGRHAVG
jgi:hypothetical protein